MTRLLTATAFIFQWAIILVACGAIGFGFIYFGYSLERASVNYAQAERMETLAALYQSTDWAAKVENEYRQRLDAEKRLEVICKKNRKACI